MVGRSAGFRPSRCHAFCARSHRLKPGDLGAARVDVDAVDVVLDDEAWNVLEEMHAWCRTSRGAISSPTSG